MNIENRVAKLELQAGISGNDCPLCSQVETRVILPDNGRGDAWMETEQHDVSFPCPSCGRPREFSVRVIQPRESHESAL